MKLTRKSNKERMFFSSISYWTLKFIVIFLVLNHYKAILIIKLLLITEVYILMIEFVFNKKPSFCFKAAYLSGNDSQYTP